MKSGRLSGTDRVVPGIAKNLGSSCEEDGRDLTYVFLLCENKERKWWVILGIWSACATILRS